MSPREIQGMLLGLLSVILFSITLPMTRITIMEIHPLLNGLGRSFVAAIPAAILLAWRREKWPTKQQMKGLAVVALGAIIVFPVCTAWAMRNPARLARRDCQWTTTLMRCHLCSVVRP